MKHLPALVLVLAAASTAACQAHTHALRAGDEVVTLDLTRGLM